MSEALVQCVARRVDDVGRRVEIWFADLEMDDVAAFCFECARLDQNFERGFRAEALHAFGEAKFGTASHDRGIKK